MKMVLAAGAVSSTSRTVSGVTMWPFRLPVAFGAGARRSSWTVAQVPFYVTSHVMCHLLVAS